MVDKKFVDDKIHIQQVGNGFGFLGEFEDFPVIDFCFYCERQLDDRYVRIFRKLIKAGLLDEEEKMMCCKCFNREKAVQTSGLDFGEILLSRM